MLSTLTSKGQVTIPQSLRQRLGLLPGQAVAFDLSRDKSYIIMRQAPSARITSKPGFGLVKVPGPHVPADWDAATVLKSRHCDAMATFDEKGFVKRATHLGWVPKVITPETP